MGLNVKNLQISHCAGQICYHKACLLFSNCSLYAQGTFPRPSSESVRDIQTEIRGWVINKGLGETLLHRAARLGYTVCVLCRESNDYFTRYC